MSIHLGYELGEHTFPCEATGNHQSTVHHEFLRPEVHRQETV